MVPTAEHHDLVIIGGGPAGYATALYGASAGLDVAIIEKNKYGGTCLHVGCIPAKELLETAAVYRHVSHAKDFGINVSEPGLDFGVTQDRKQGIIDKLSGGLVSMMKGRKITVLEGTGSLTGPGQVKVTGGQSGDVELTADSILLAAGSVPRTIPGFEVDGTTVVTSDELLALRELPSSAIVIGGGAIGCEFASMMSDLGTQVTILEALPKILPGCDTDVANIVVRSFKKRGIDIRTGVKVNGHTPRDGGGTTVHLEGGDDIEVETVVVSVGRRPYADELGLDNAGVASDDRGFVQVGETCRTSVDGIWAAGDLIATPQLAHVGFAEGMVVVKDILGENPLPVDYGKVPWAIYCHPEVAFAGYSEDAAKEAGYDVVTSKHRYAPNGRAMIVGETDGLVKVIAEKRPDGTGGQVLGVHMVGPWVTEQLGQGYLAVNWEATVDEIAQFIQPHPTMSEVFGETVIALTGRSLH
ncbi:MAG: dihydrolipoyl dehydrogenase [Actinomycetota bacterium]|nr:dihydrolipoyl dehydrogenase [Actinomycetota bacterium]